jgi:phage regulator Rha-like protein
MYLLIKSFCEKQKEDEQKKLLRKDSKALLKDFERIINFNEDESDEESDKIDNLEPKRDAQIINFANLDT